MWHRLCIKPGSNLKPDDMKTIMRKLTQTWRLVPVAGLVALFAGLVGVYAWPSVPPTNPMAQRNAMNQVLNQIKWFQATTRTGGSYVGGGYRFWGINE
jgi:hypothetical protein